MTPDQRVQTIRALLAGAIESLTAVALLLEPEPMPAARMPEARRAADIPAFYGDEPTDRGNDNAE